MKKFLWLIFFSLLFVSPIKAKVYYSEYSDFSDFQEERVDPTDVIDVKKESRYLWYKNNEVLNDYELYNSNDNFSDDCYFTDYSPWMNEKIENEGYISEERIKYDYTLSKEIRYIHLYNLQGSYDAFRITELSVKYDNIPINYTYTCNGCWENFGDYINNGIYDENKSYIDNGGSLIIDLGKTYPIHLIDMVFYIFDLGDNDKLYTIGYSKDMKNIFAQKSYNLKFSDEYWKNAVKRTQNVDELNINDWQYKEEKTQLQNDEYVIDFSIKKEYRYKEKWCRTYSYEKEYSDYSKEPINDFTNRVDESLKYFYSYRTREKLELELKEITDKNFDLNDLVIASTDKVEIRSNINWDQNGFYDVEFKVNNLIIKEKVKLNIESNTIQQLEKQYEDKINELEKMLHNCNINKDLLNKKIVELTNQYKKEIDELKNLNNVYINKITKLEDDIKNLNNDISSITKEKEDLANKLNDKIEKNVEVPNFMLKIGFLDIKFIIIIFLILLCISYLLGKKSKKK